MQEKKKILILGGAEGQIKLIKAAKREGYYVILCDYTTTNPGIKLADKHYQVSTMDRKLVLEIATKERINGIISNSEPVMDNVSYIAEKLNLLGNPFDSINILLSKDKFRNLQEELGLYAPKHYIPKNKEDFWNKLQQFELPVIIKPVKSSGSRGTTKINELDYNNCINAYDECINFSRNHQCSIESFVESSINYIIDGDVFVYKDKYLWNGMFFNYRHNYFKMIPTTESWPLCLSDNVMSAVKSTIQKIFKKLNIIFGEFNVEMYLNKKKQLFVIEINPRQGGCDIPISIKKHCGIDLSRLLVTLSVGDEYYWQECLRKKVKNNFFSKHMVFSTKSGILKGLYIDEEIKKYVKKVEYKNHNSINGFVNKSENATSVIAHVNLLFDTYKNQKKYDDKLEKYIYPIIEDGGDN